MQLACCKREQPMIPKSIPIERAIEMAAEMHRSGQLERAEAMYVDILRQDPGNVDAIHLLGVLARQGGRPDVAVQLIGRAVERRPDAPIIQFNYADALYFCRRFDEAVTHYRKAVELAPDHYDAHNNLATALIEMRLFGEAAAACRAAIAIDPARPHAYNTLGNALRGDGRIDDALEAYSHALQREPNFVEALNNMGLVLGAAGRPFEAVEKLRAAVRLRPGLEDAHNNLGAVLARCGRLSEAIECFETALRLNPKHADANNNLGSALKTQGRHAQALPCFEKAAEQRPRSVDIHHNLAMTLKDVGRGKDALDAIDVAIDCDPKSATAHFGRGLILRDLNRADDAIESLRKALSISPDRPDIQSALGYALQERGELDEALELLQKSINTFADPQTHSNVLLVMNYHPDITPAKLFEAHRAYARVHEEPCKRSWKPHPNTRDPNRRLRVGYFSPDFRGHAVSFFSWPIFENHDHEQFEVFAYSNHFAADATTLLQRARIDHWRDTIGLTVDQVAQLIRDDCIDILVELAGHTALNGLPVLARKPAPIQMNGIGYPSTTGLSAIDYRITDAICDPPGLAEQYNSERLLRLPDVFWCYQPPESAPAVGRLPADTNGHVTFVSVNNFTKVTPQVLECWARIVSRVPGSRMLMQTQALNSQIVRERVTSIFSRAGVDQSRLDLRTWSPFPEYLQLIQSCDIMLDTFPFNGGTTSCHGLWMGVPIVALAGATHCGRMGMSMLSCIGLPELCAPDESQYVETAVNLAQDRHRLREMRAGMRARLTESPLLQGERYVRRLESAYREVWRAWCEGPAAASDK